jgi:protein phosphatase
MTTAARTHKGNVREINQDSLLMRGGLLIVADGMGGHRGGEVASRMAVDAVAEYLSDPGPYSAAELEAAVQEANRRVFAESAAKLELRGMGTTMTLCALTEETASFAHVGDSRAYMMRNGKLTRLTRDHSLVEELVRNGYITREQAAVHPHRHVITRALGSEGRVRVDQKRVAVQSGDLILLCTDGVTLYLTDSQIEQLLRREESVESYADTLVDLALEMGGEDNISVALARVEGGEAP